MIVPTPLFPLRQTPAKPGYEDFQSECALDEEAEEALERLSGFVEREMGR